MILENRSREYVEARIRAGVLEQGVVDLLTEAGVGERLAREGLVHGGIELQFAGERHRVDMAALTGGKAITVYGQTEVVKDLIAARLGHGAAAAVRGRRRPARGDRVGAAAGAVRARGRRRPCSSATSSQGATASTASAARRFRPESSERSQREYPFGWLGILAAVAPSNDELVYAHHERGFALLSLRSPELSRLYVQCRPDEDIDAWPDERIWEELQVRLGLPGWTLTEGPILEKGITPMRSFVAEPLRHGRLFLAGDAAHIVPPTGAKGLNLAVHDVRLLADALAEWYRTGNQGPLDAYSTDCLRRVWRAEHFSWWMTTMLHRPEGGDPFDLRLQESQLRYVTTSPAAATSLAENYVGLESV